MYEGFQNCLLVNTSFSLTHFSSHNLVIIIAPLVYPFPSVCLPDQCFLMFVFYSNPPLKYMLYYSQSTEQSKVYEIILTVTTCDALLIFPSLFIYPPLSYSVFLPKLARLSS